MEMGDGGGDGWWRWVMVVEMVVEMMVEMVVEMDS